MASVSASPTWRVGDAGLTATNPRYCLWIKGPAAYDFSLLSSLTKTQAEKTVVHSPSLLPMADWVILEVRTILPDILKRFSRSSQAVSGSNSIPKVFAVFPCLLFRLAEGMVL